MTASELQAALDELGYSQRGFAHFARVDERTVRRWVAGDLAVPGWCEVMISLLYRVANPEKAA